MDAVIKGPIPNANIETLPKAPPENKSKKPIMLFPEAILENISLFMPKPVYECQNGTKLTCQK